MRKTLKIAGLTLAIAALLFGIHLYISFYVPASRDGGVKTINIQRGASFRLIAANLEREGVIRDSESFIFVASLLGAYKKVKAGEYEFDRSMTPMEVLELLVKGRVKRHMVTIPEGYDINDIASALASDGLTDAKEFSARARDPKLAAGLGVEGPTLEGYLFPDTYDLTKGMTADEIIARMVERFKAVYFPEIERLAREKGLTMRKAVTLASIIEKETGAPEERALISAVFQNRLKKGIRLQSDPTVIYGIRDFDGNLTRKHLETKTPYNTYANYGLPPGPIANPGKASLLAALNPANEEFLYFVSKNDGTHYFSRDLNDHSKAVRKYQKAIKVNARKEG